MELLIREPLESDVPFLVSTWRNALMYSSPTFQYVKKESLINNYTPVIQKMLSKYEVRVACLQSDPDIILGYSVSSGDTLHFVYIKKAWRNQGICNMLLGSTDFKNITHITKTGLALAQKRGWAFDPFLI